MSYWVNLKEFGDERGKLVSVENNDLPFKIERFFYIYETDTSSVRGNHANRNSSFLFICLIGECDILIDDGLTRQTYRLNSPKTALFCPKGLWKEMFNFKLGTVLLVVSDHAFDNNEYIRNYKDFKEYCKNHD